MTFVDGALYYVRSANKGRSWTIPFELVPTDSVPGQIFNRPISASGNNVYVVWGNRLPSGVIRAVKIRRSTNGGRDWLAPEVLLTNNPPEYFYQPLVAAVDSNVLVTVVKNLFPQNQYYLLHSSDSGNSWSPPQPINPLPGNYAYADLGVAVNRVHFVYRVEEDILHTASSDNGNSWSTPQILSEVDGHPGWYPDIGVTSSAVYVCWQDAKYGSSTGFSGTVLLRRSTDGGETWGAEVRVSEQPSAAFSSIAVADSSVVVVWDDERNGVTQGSIQLRASFDRGVTWCPETSAGDTLDIDIDASVTTDSRHICVVWSASESPPTIPPRIFSRFGRFDRSNSVDWRTSQSIEGNMHLLIHPNPFNSSTQFNFGLPDRATVSLLIYDLLGRQVGMVAPGFYQAGYHSVTWNAGEMASGIYFARFTAVDEHEKLVYSKTNKLVLMK